MEWDERISMWRVRHYKVVARMIGDCVVGTQGTPVEVLGRLIHNTFFPELWRARNELTALSQENVTDAAVVVGRGHVRAPGRAALADSRPAPRAARSRAGERLARRRDREPARSRSGRRGRARRLGLRPGARDDREGARRCGPVPRSTSRSPTPARSPTTMRASTSSRPTFGVVFAPQPEASPQPSSRASAGRAAGSASRPGSPMPPWRRSTSAFSEEQRLPSDAWGDAERLERLLGDSFGLEVERRTWWVSRTPGPSSGGSTRPPPRRSRRFSARCRRATTGRFGTRSSISTSATATRTACADPNEYLLVLGTAVDDDARSGRKRSTCSRR